MVDSVEPEPHDVSRVSLEPTTDHQTTPPAEFVSETDSTDADVFLSNEEETPDSIAESETALHFLPCIPPCGFMTEKRVGEGQDAEPFSFSWSTESSDRILIAVFDGMGGAGASKVPDVNDHERLVPMAYLASRGARKALVSTSNQVAPKMTAYDIVDLIKDRIVDEMTYLTTRPGGLPESRMRGSSIKNYPTTMAGALIEEQSDGTRRVFSVWAGDSRVYTLIPQPDLLLQQLTKDHSGTGDFAEGGDAALTKCLTPETVDLDVQDVLLGEDAIVIAATDGCYAYESYKFLVTTLIEQMDRSADEQEYAANLAREFSAIAGDDCSMAISFPPRLPFEDARQRFRPFLRDLQDLRLVPRDNQFVSLAQPLFSTQILMGE